MFPQKPLILGRVSLNRSASMYIRLRNMMIISIIILVCDGLRMRNAIMSLFALWPNTFCVSCCITRCCWCNYLTSSGFSMHWAFTPKDARLFSEDWKELNGDMSITRCIQVLNMFAENGLAWPNVVHRRMVRIGIF